MNETTNYQIPTTRYQLKPGLSLIEFLTGFAIIGVIAIMIGSVWLAHSKIYSTQSATIDAQSASTIAIDEIANQIRESNGVVYSCLIQNPCESDTSGITLVLQVWPLNASGVPFDPGSNDPDYIVYRLNDPPNDKNFVKSVYANNRTGSTRKELNKKILASNVDSINFTYLANDGTTEIAPGPGLTETAQVIITVYFKAETIYDRTEPEPIPKAKKVILRNKE